MQQAGIAHLFVRGKDAQFCPGRKWQFDFYCPTRQLAVEVEGGSWAGGRHTRGSGFSADAEKYNAAAIAGIRVLRFDSRMIPPPRPYRKEARTAAEKRRRALDGTALATIKLALGAASDSGHTEVSRPEAGRYVRNSGT